MSGVERGVGDAVESRRRKVFRWLLRSLLLLLVVLAAGAAYLRANLEDWARSAIVDAVREQLGGEARIGDLTIELLRLSASAEDVSVRLAPGQPGRFDMQIERIRIRLPWSSLGGLRAGRIHLALLEVTGPRLITDDALFERPPEPSLRQPLEIDLRIDRLDIRDGHWIHEEVREPLELELAGVELRGSWSADRRAMLGRAACRLSVVYDPIVEPLTLDVAAGFRWRGRTLEVLEGHAAGGGLASDFRGEAELEAPLRFAASGELTADLDAFDALLDRDFPRIAGTAAGAWEVQYGTDGLRVEGEFAAERARLDDLRAVEARARVVYTSGLLQLDGVDALAYGGHVSGSVDVGLGGSTTIDLDLVGRGLASRELMDWIQLPLPLDAELDADFTMQGDLARRESWNAVGEFHATAWHAGDGVPVSGVGQFTLEDGRLTVSASEARAAAATFGVDLRLDLRPGEALGRIELDGTTADARATQLATLRLFDALDFEAPDLVAEELYGSGQLRAAIAIGGPTDVRFGLALGPGSWGPQRFDRLTVDAEVDPYEVRVMRVELVDGPSRVAGALSLDLDGPRLSAVDLQAERIELAQLLDLLDLESEIDGQLTGTLTSARGAETTSGGGSLVLEHGQAFGESFERIAADVSIDGSRFHLTQLVAHGEAFEAAGEAWLDQETSLLRVAIANATVRVGELQAVRDAPTSLAATLELAGELRIDVDGPSGRFDVQGYDVAIAAIRLGDFSGEVALESGRLAAELRGQEEARWTLIGRLALDETLDLDATLELDRALIDWPASGEDPIWIRLTGGAQIGGSLARPEALVVAGVIEAAELFLAGRTLRLDGESPLRLANQVFEAGPFRLQGPVTGLESRLRYDLANDAIEADSSGVIDLALVALALPEVRASGAVEVEIGVRGSLVDPELSGSLQLRGGRARYLGFPQTLEQIDAVLRLREERIEVESLSAVLGGGEVVARGTVGVGRQGLSGIDLALDAYGVRLDMPEGFEAIYDARLALRGDARASTLRGRVELVRGVYDEEFDLTALLGYGVREYSSDDVLALPENVTLDVEISAPGNVWVRNEILEVETSFEIQLAGTLQRPEITGRLSMIEGGKVRFRQVEYRIADGSLDFIDPDRLNPYLFLKAETNVRGYEIFLRVEGPLDQFEYELTSNPALSSQDIIALLTSGRTMQELTGSGGSAGAEFTGDLAANYFAGALTGRFEKQLQRVLGLERVQINPLLVEGTDPTTRVTLGKKISDEVFVIVSTDIGATERELYQIEWSASRKVQLIAERDTDGGVGGNVRYTDHFWWKRPPQPRQVALAATDDPADVDADVTRSVAEVRFVGVAEVEQGTLRRRVALQAGDDYRRSDMYAGVEALRRHYVREGRLQARVNATVEPAEDASRGVVVIYDINPGPLLDVRIEGVTKKEEKLLRTDLRRLWTESLFVESLALDTQARISGFFRARGFYAVDVQYEERAGATGPQLIFQVDKGKPVRVEAILIEGVEQVAEERIRRQMLTRPTSPFNRKPLDPELLRDDIAAIRNLYRDLGYLDARIAEPRIRLAADGASATITLQIVEGPLITIAEVVFPSDTPFPAERLAAWAGLETGRPFSRSVLLGAESDLRSALDGEGYPDARARGRVERAETSVTLQFEIDTGPQLRVEEVAVRGHLLTKESVIRRELELGPGDFISREKMLRSQHRLYRLGVFRSVRVEHEPFDETDPSLRRLVVRVDEARPLSVGVGVGYNTEAGASFSLNTTQDNLGGRVRTLGFQGEVSGILERYQLVAKEPRLFGRDLPTLATIAWEEREQESFTVRRRSTALRLDRKLGEKWRGYLRYSYQHVDVFDVLDPLALQGEKLEDVILGDIGLALIRDTRDDVVAPTSGGYFSLSSRVFAEPLISDATFVKTTLTAYRLWSYRNGTTFGSGVRIGAARRFGDTATVPVSERFFSGGDSTNRGFQRDRLGPLENDLPIGGEGLLLLNQEFRFPILGPLRGVVFYDAGNVYRVLGDFSVTDLRHTLGGGLRVETPIGAIRAEYGFKLDREPDEDGGQFIFAIGSVF